MSLKIKTLGELVHRTSVTLHDADAELIGGEFAMVNGDFEVEEWGSATAPVVGTDDGVFWQVFQSTNGRMDRLGTGKATLVYGTYFADVDVYCDDTFAAGDELTIKEETVTDSNGDSVTGSFVAPAASLDLVVAKCICPESPRGAGWMRIQTCSQYYKD